MFRIADGVMATVLLAFQGHCPYQLFIYRIPTRSAVLKKLLIFKIGFQHLEKVVY